MISALWGSWGTTGLLKTSTEALTPISGGLIVHSAALQIVFLATTALGNSEVVTPSVQRGPHYLALKTWFLLPMCPQRGLRDLVCIITKARSLGIINTASHSHHSLTQHVFSKHLLHTRLLATGDRALGKQIRFLLPRADVLVTEGQGHSTEEET